MAGDRVTHIVCAGWRTLPLARGLSCHAVPCMIWHPRGNCIIHLLLSLDVATLVQRDQMNSTVSCTRKKVRLTSGFLFVAGCSALSATRRTPYDNHEVRVRYRVRPAEQAQHAARSTACSKAYGGGASGGVLRPLSVTRHAWPVE